MQDASRLHGVAAGSVWPSRLGLRARGLGVDSLPQLDEAVARRHMRRRHELRQVRVDREKALLRALVAGGGGWFLERPGFTKVSQTSFEEKNAETTSQNEPLCNSTENEASHLLNYQPMLKFGAQKDAHTGVSG